MAKDSHYDQSAADYAVGFIAVSYTHLDVYKRQGFYLSGCCIWKKQSLVLGRSPYQWQHEPVPVSYTHLYAGDVTANVENARRYSRFAVDAGYIPIAPHLLFPQFLNDDNPCLLYTSTFL